MSFLVDLVRSLSKVFLCAGAVTAVIASPSNAWTLDRTIVDGWAAIKLTSDNGDVSFHCVGALPDENARRRQPDTLHLPRFPTLEDGIFLLLGPETLPVTQRALVDVSLTVGGRAYPLRRVEHSEHEGVYWTVLDEADTIILPSDSDLDLVIQRGLSFTRNQVTQSRIPITDAAEFYSVLVQGCRELLN